MVRFLIFLFLGVFFTLYIENIIRKRKFKNRYNDTIKDTKNYNAKHTGYSGYCCSHCGKEKFSRGLKTEE